MNCDSCGTTLKADDFREHSGKKFCEDCYLEAVAAGVKACDPWAVLLAKGDMSRTGVHLTSLQQKLYDLVKAEGQISFPEAGRRLNLTEEEVRREFATLRHMELLRAVKQRRDVFLALF